MLLCGIHVLTLFAAEESISPSLAFLFLLIRCEISEAAGLDDEELEIELAPAPLEVDEPSPFVEQRVSRTRFIVCGNGKKSF